MGTVGLNFGSPTSGAGFDVSSTVAQIVGNLQNVETPWKNQLTGLESQDTAISSLGTLFSNLSNDMSSLTDFQGVMAQKEGSSSDQNVLELTDATSSAVAGTHTIEVKSLAQTSAGYLATVSNSSAALSGSITLQVGRGTAHTIAIGAAPASPAANTIYTGSGVSTLAGLAAAINSAGVGITANVLPNSKGSVLSLVSGTSGATGNMTVSGNTLTAAAPNPLSYTGTAGTGSVVSTGTLSPAASAGDTLSGTLSIQVGSGTAQTVSMSNVANSLGSPTLANLATYITNNSATLGVSASVVTNSDGSSSLSLTSATQGSAGTLTANSSIADSITNLGYTSTVPGADAQLTVDGIAGLTSSSNTVSNLISGVTFQLLAPSATESDGSLAPVQVVIANDNSGVESAVGTMVSDYNSAISAINLQQGNDSSGRPEPLFGSPTLSLLQEQLLSSLNVQNPNGYLDSISSTDGTTLTGSMVITVGGGTVDTVVVGSGANSVGPNSGTYYTNNTAAGGVNNGNTLAGLAATINAINASTSLSYTGTTGTGTGVTPSSGTLTAVSANDALSGSFSIQVGSGGAAENIVIGSTPAAGAAANTLYTDGGVSTLSDLASFINDNSSLGATAAVTTDGSGVATLTLTSGTAGAAGTLTVNPSLIATSAQVTASVGTSNGQSSLTLASGTVGAAGTVTATSAITAMNPTPVTYSDTGGFNSATVDSGTLTIQSGADTLAGTITIQVGGGTSQSITLSGSNNTLSGLVAAINSLNLGVTAALDWSGTTLTLTSATPGSAGALAVTSNIYDTTNSTSQTLNYNNSSDVSSLTSLGISVNNDGSLTFDATSLDSLLNSDYAGVLGFFQNANGWGQTFSNVLTSAGTAASTGVLALASNSNSNIESTLNANVAKEDSLISAQQKSLTAELDTANQILQQLPSQLQGLNELYSAITGYNQGQNG